MKKSKVVFENKFIQVNQNEDGYIWYECPWSNSMGVSILPYRESGYGRREFLGVYEVSPAHGDQPRLGAIQGGYDNSDEFTIPQCAINELEEEGGYTVPEKDLISLGQVYNSKASNNITYLFAVDLTNTGRRVEASGDGTGFEHGMWATWASEGEILSAYDPLLSVMFARLFAKKFVQHFR